MFGYEVNLGDFNWIVSQWHIVGLSLGFVGVSSLAWLYRRRMIQEQRLSWAKRKEYSKGKVGISPKDLADLHFQNHELEDQVNDLQAEIVDMDFAERCNQSYIRSLEDKLEGLNKPINWVVKIPPGQKDSLIFHAHKLRNKATTLARYAHCLQYGIKWDGPKPTQFAQAEAEEIRLMGICDDCGAFRPKGELMNQHMEICHGGDYSI